MRRPLRSFPSILSLVICLFTSTVVYGEEILTLRRALQLGIEKSLDLKAEEMNIPITEGGLEGEEGNFDPELEATLSAKGEKTPAASALAGTDAILTREETATLALSKEERFGLKTRLSLTSQRSRSNSSFESLDPQYRSLLVLDVTQPLLKDFGMSGSAADLRVAENRLLQAGLGYAERLQILAEEIETAYLFQVRSREILSFRTESRELARELLEGNRRKFELGLIPLSEVNQAETAVAARDELVVLARQDVDRGANTLRDLLGVGGVGEIVPIAGIDRTFPDESEAVEIALRSRPDLERQRIEAIIGDIRLAFAENQSLPRLDLVASLGLNGLSGADAGNPAAGKSSYEGGYGDSFSRLAGGDGYAWYAGLNFSYPLGNREGKGNVKSAAAEKRQTLYRLKRLEERIETDVRDAVIAVRRSRERVEVAGRFESLAEMTLAQETTRFHEGLSDTFRLLDLQDDLIDAEVRRVTALSDFHTALAHYYKVMGINLERYGLTAVINRQESSDVAY